MAKFPVGSLDLLLDDDSDDEFENKEWEQKFTGKSGFIFVIDGRESMFHGGKESHFTKSFMCCLKAMLQIAREQRYDLVAFVIFGTNKTEGKFAPSGTVLFQPLLTPSVLTIKKIMQTIESQFEDIKKNFGHGKNVSINKVLNFCKNMLHYCKTKLYTKSIVLFTCDDDPHRNDPQSAHSARKRAEELREHSIDLDVVGFGSFDSSLFYKELVLTARGELLKDWVGKDPVKKISDVETEIASLTKKSTRHYGMFYLGGRIQMKLMFYKLFHEPLKLIWASKDDFFPKEEEPGSKINEAANERNIFEQETQEMTPGKVFDEPSKRNVIEKYPLIGAEYIPMSKKELRRYEPKVPRGLTLIGFKPISSIPIQTVEEPYFLLPDSSDKVGEEIFSHLLHSCLKKGVAPICWYSFNKIGNPILVALYPTEPGEYAKNKFHSYGFHLLRLPFSDMITDPVTDDLPEVESSEAQIEAAKKIIKKTTINWSPDTFSDVEYKTRLAMIEAIAMDYNDAEVIEDQTNIDLDSVGEHLGELSIQFTDCSHIPPELLGKRSGTDNSNAAKSKQPKIDDLSYLAGRVQAGEANKLTVAQLRELLKGEGIRSLSALNKPRLVSIANERFSS